ncbi:MAG: Flp pilus assembly complex ATPase component TadA [Actinobacteria bacterium]|nr:Flp pilus assembly complex ATPase component TadA [Actinomycetota bacterium]
MGWTRERIGDILVNAGLITQKELENALLAQKKSGKPIGRILIENSRVSEDQIAHALARQKNLPVVDLNEYNINVHAVASIPETVAKRHMVIPIDYKDGYLVLAMSNPLDVHAVDDLRVITGYDIKPVVSTETAINNAINQYLKGSVEDVVATVAAQIKEVEEKEEKRIQKEDSPVVKIVDSIIVQAISKEASDIHIEPQADDVKIRYRIDGVLYDIMSIPKNLQSNVISRFKIMSDINIAEHRIPQDGRCSLKVEEKDVDFRVATLPTAFGESVNLRILDKSKALLELKDLGLLPDSLERFKSFYTKPYGTLIVTGPTGSGKSTTLYATLNILNSSAKKIITIEDPIEYQLPGVLQAQVNTATGLTFGRGLRSIVRCDPDIIMIGEIRDLETARIAIESALTGHLVLSSLHTNDAAGALTRLTEMGIEPFLISSSVSCVMAQRLVRKLCNECKEEYEPSVELLKASRVPFNEGEKIKLWQSKGCKRCHNTGFKGRVGIYEVMLMNMDIEKLCITKSSSDEMKEAAIRGGMKTLWEDGVEKVKKGITSLEEVLRVVV